VATVDLLDALQKEREPFFLAGVADPVDVFQKEGSRAEFVHKAEILVERGGTGVVEAF